MSSYTTQLKTLIEQATQYEEGLSSRDKIEEGRKKLFDFDYPIFDDEYKKVFETHFIRHFYIREIGFETEGLFKFQLETWLMIHMPYFNKLFESELLKFDPFLNSEVDVTHNKKNDRLQTDERDTTQDSNTSGTSTGQTDGKSNTESNSQKDSNGNVIDNNFERDIESNNPDSRLQLTANDGQGVIEYASQINENKKNNNRDTTNSETGTDSQNTTDEVTNNTTTNTDTNATQNDKLNSTINDIEDYVQHRAGKIGVQSYSKMLMEYRQSFIRIEKQIFEEMQELFMLVY